MKLFITGIGTDVGKTIASAIVTEALEADYWKPIQAGDSMALTPNPFSCNCLAMFFTFSFPGIMAD